MLTVTKSVIARCYKSKDNFHYLDKGKQEL